MLSTDESPGRLGPATSTDVLPNSLRKDGVRFCRRERSSRDHGSPLYQWAVSAAAWCADAWSASTSFVLAALRALHVDASGASALDGLCRGRWGVG
jgi:hypothetical protein